MSAETLRKAAALVLERGLARGRYEDEQGRVDAAGALRIVHTGTAWKRPLEIGEYIRDYNAVRRVLPVTEIGLPPGNLIVWSSQQERAEDVARAFESAAAQLEAAS